MHQKNYHGEEKYIAENPTLFQVWDEEPIRKKALAIYAKAVYYQGAPENVATWRSAVRDALAYAKSSFTPV